MHEIDIIRQLLERTRLLQFNDNKELDDIRRKGKMALENLFPIKMYWIEIGNIKLKQNRFGDIPNRVLRDDWLNGQNQLINLFDTAIQDYELQLRKKNDQPTIKIPEVIIKEKIVPVIDESAIHELKEQFQDYRQSVRKWSYFLIATLTTTTGIWLFYIYSNWTWFNGHDKKIGITLLTNLTLVLFLLNIPIRRSWVIWIPTAIAVLATLLTII